jgi:hypothetical protein
MLMCAGVSCVAGGVGKSESADIRDAPEAADAVVMVLFRASELGVSGLRLSRDMGGASTSGAGSSYAGGSGSADGLSKNDRCSEKRRGLLVGGGVSEEATVPMRSSAIHRLA